MIRYPGVIREAATILAEAAEGTKQYLQVGAIEQEPAFTDRMLGRMEHAIEGFRSRGIRWRAKTLTDRGRGSQESRFGADFAGVVEIDLPDYIVRKGFLAQAKLLEPGESLVARELARLRDQCDDMLSRTPDAFVFVYSFDSISVIPAIAVASARGGVLHHHYKRSVRRFYEEHFSCFIGDKAISEPTPHMLEQLPEHIPARTLLALRAENAPDNFV